MASRNLPPVPRRWTAIALITLSLCVPVVVWETNARVQDDPLLAPTLGEIGRALLGSAASGDLWYHASITIQSALMGLAIATVGGIALGVLMAQSRLAMAIFAPLLSATYPVPKLALYPILILALGLGTLPVVILVALECLYPVAYNTVQGVQSTNRELVRAAANVDAGWFRTFGAVQVPSALPSVLTGVRIAVPIMVVVAVVVEMLGQSRGLGFMIRDAGRAFEPALAFAVILLLGCVGLVLDQMLQFATRRLVFWEAQPHA